MAARRRYYESERREEGIAEPTLGLGTNVEEVSDQMSCFIRNSILGRCSARQFDDLYLVRVVVDHDEVGAELSHRPTRSQVARIRSLRNCVIVLRRVHSVFTVLL